MAMVQQSPNSSWRDEYTQNLMCIFELISKTPTQVEESDNLAGHKQGTDWNQEVND